MIKDLVVDRTAFDRIIQAGGYTSINVGGAQDGNAILISKNTVEQAMDSAACIGCGACVAACKNASAALFTSAKVSHLGLLPQGQVERYTRVAAMVHRHDAEGFGSCSNEGECEAVCPKEIPIVNIARMNRDYFRAMLLIRDVNYVSRSLPPEGGSHDSLSSSWLPASAGRLPPRYLVNDTVALRVLPPGPMAVTVAM